ncbi:MAG: hypothetical protein ACI4MH_03505 [Candidatus Coproplasma sp.]
MAVNNNGSGRTKADEILSKVDVISEQNNSIDQKIEQVIMSAEDREMDIEAIMQKLNADNKALLQEIEFLSAQIQSIYKGLSKNISEATVKSKAQDDSVTRYAAEEEMNVDELSSKVAEKIIVPQNDIDYDQLAEQVAARMVTAQAEAQIDLDLLADKVAERISLPEATAQVDVDQLAEQVAARIVLPEEKIDADALAVLVAEKLGAAPAQVDADVLAASVAEKLGAAPAQVDSDALAVLVAAKLGATPAQIDADALAQSISEKITIPESALRIDSDELGFKVAESLYVPSAIVENINYQELAAKVAAFIPAQEVISPDYIASKVTEQLVCPVINEDALADRIAERLGVVTVAPAEVTVDEDRIACSVAEKLRAVMPECEQAEPECEEVEEVTEEVAEEITGEVEAQQYVEEQETEAEQVLVYDDVAVCEDTVAQETVTEECAEENAAPSIDLEALADMVAARIAVPAPAEVDIDALATRITVPSVPEIDLEALADKIASKLNVTIDDREIADCIAKKVGTISPEQFDVMVDEDGCDSLARAVESKLDYDAISAAVAERIGGSVGGVADVDSDEIARQLSEKLNVGVQINEDALADKAAAVLSNFMPEIDTDEIAEKVVAGVVPALPQVEVDGEGIASSVAEKIAEKQEEQDFDIVIDEEGLERITESVSEKIKGEYDERFNKVDEDVAQIREIAEGAKGEYDERFNKVDEDVAQIREIAEGAKGEYDERFNKVDEDVAQIREITEGAKGEYTERFDKVDSDIREIKAMLAAGVIAVAASNEIAPAEAVEEETVVEEELVTVSDIVEEQTACEESDEQDEVIEEIVDGIDETYAEGEIMPDGIPGISNSGVDFANMMKYNRSFIARIIQGSDEQKQYYGQVKNALLSYKKVNSNISWGAERFNKGRETIARFKIRGKTLCLYLALDPNEYPASVYHQVDVSDNKSMSGTPMMVKIKSPRGAKKAIRLIDEMLEKRQGIKQHIAERDYAAMYPYETIEELIEDGLVKDVSKK